MIPTKLVSQNLIISLLVSVVTFFPDLLSTRTVVGVLIAWSFLEFSQIVGTGWSVYSSSSLVVLMQTGDSASS